MKSKLVIKMDQDDLLRIAMNAVAEKYNLGTFSSSSMLLGEPGNNLRAIFTFDELEAESNNNFELLDKETPFNWDEHVPEWGNNKKSVLLNALNKMVCKKHKTKK